jgi:hypothetical protein
MYTLIAFEANVSWMHRTFIDKERVLVKYVNDPTVPVVHSLDVITHAFGDPEVYDELMGYWATGQLRLLTEPQDGAFAFYTDTSVLTAVLDYNPNAPEGETFEEIFLGYMENLCHYGRVILKPEGVDLEGDLVVTSMDKDWEHPRLTATTDFPLDMIQGVFWVLPPDPDEELEAVNWQLTVEEGHEVITLEFPEPGSEEE